LRVVEDHRAAPGHAPATLNLSRGIVEQRCAWMGIGVDEDQPVAGRGGSARIARTADLVHGLEDDRRAGRARDRSRLVARVVVADDEFGRPAARVERRHRGPNAAKGCSELAFLVERRNNHRDSHVATLKPVASGFSRKKAEAPAVIASMRATPRAILR
jgi:hypothetical protein